VLLHALQLSSQLQSFTWSAHVRLTPHHHLLPPAFDAAAQLRRKQSPTASATASLARTAHPATTLVSPVVAGERVAG